MKDFKVKQLNNWFILSFLVWTKKKIEENKQNWVLNVTFELERAETIWKAPIDFEMEEFGLQILD